LVAELTGDLKPTGGWTRSALLAGTFVVTANRQSMAHCAPELLRLSRRRNCHLAFGASVAGGVPVISALEDGLAGDELFKI